MTSLKPNYLFVFCDRKNSMSIEVFLEYVSEGLVDDTS